jgi:hypothetical protein
MQSIIHDAKASAQPSSGDPAPMLSRLDLKSGTTRRHDKILDNDGGVETHLSWLEFISPNLGALLAVIITVELLVMDEKVRNKTFGQLRKYCKTSIPPKNCVQIWGDDSLASTLVNTSTNGTGCETVALELY